MDTSDTEAIARGVFAEIAKSFPSLKMVENHGEPVEISITMPVQPGLTHEVWLCLQNRDELGFSVGHFTSRCSRAQNRVAWRNTWMPSPVFCQASTEFLSSTGEQGAIRLSCKGLRATAGALLPLGPRFGFRCLLRGQ